MKVLQRIKQFSFVIGVGLTVLSLFFLYTGDSAIRNPQRVLISSKEGDRLLGFYHEPPDTLDYGVLMLEGFGSDQVSMRSAANEFVREGFQVFTFDFSGHGRSEGTLKLDNASTDVQSHQVLSALHAFQNVSGLDIDHIFLFGHSLGARVALQAVVMNELDIAGLILLGPQINVVSNAQSEFFTGINDNDISWVAEMDVTQPEVPILILSGGWEDILPVPAAVALMSQLTEVTFIESGVIYGEDPMTREWIMLPGVFHNFEIYSPRALNYSVDWIADQIDVELNHTRLLNPSAKKIIFWFSAIAGILLFLSGASQFSKDHEVSTPQSSSVIRNRKIFLAAKAWLWFPAILVGGLLIAPFFFLPLGLPLFNVYYVVFIGGYGILTLVLYLLKKMPGVSGKINLKEEITLSDQVEWRYVLGVNVLFGVVLLFFAQSGWYWIPPTGDRLIWLLIFTPFTAVGLWAGTYDQNLFGVDDHKGTRFVQLNGFLPFILYAVLMMMLGSWSGMINGVIGLFVLWIISQQGKITVIMTGSRWVAALLQAVMLYLVVLPQGVLFTL